MTERMVLAVANPHVDILGHCTGRMIGKRPPSTFDADYVFAACKQFGTAVEINCRPERLDPPRELLDVAIAYDCWFSIDTDAHATGQLEWQPHGCDRAAERDVPIEKVINTMSADDLLAWTSSRPDPSVRATRVPPGCPRHRTAGTRRQDQSVGEGGVGGHQEAGAADVADGALAHHVHHVAEAHPGVEVDDGQRAAPAAPEGRARVRADRHLRAGRPNPMPWRSGTPSTRSMPLICSSNTTSTPACDSSAHAVGLAAARHRRVDQRHRAGVAVAAGGGDLGPPPRDLPRPRRRRAPGC